jgi:hypothetical protein
MHCRADAWNKRAVMPDHVAGEAMRSARRLHLLGQS